MTQNTEPVRLDSLSPERQRLTLALVKMAKNAESRKAEAAK